MQQNCFLRDVETSFTGIKVAQMFHDLEHSWNNEQMDAQRAWKVLFWQTLRVEDGKRDDLKISKKIW